MASSWVAKKDELTVGCSAAQTAERRVGQTADKTAAKKAARTGTCLAATTAANDRPLSSSPGVECSRSLLPALRPPLGAIPSPPFDAAKKGVRYVLYFF